MAANESFSGKLTQKQQDFMALLLAGVQIVAAARQLKIGEATAHRWLNMPQFQTAYQALQEELFNEKLTRLRDGVDLAIDTLKAVMHNANESPAAQVRAAQIWLEQTLTLHKFEQGIAQKDTLSESGLPGELLGWLTNDELGVVARLQMQIDEVLDKARARKLEADQPGVTSINSYRRATQ
jgi:hypothetical protein